MTVICWDGTTLAADRQMTDGWLKCHSRTKIHRLPTGTLVGCAGNAAACNELAAWWADPTKSEKDFPAHLRDADKYPAKMLVIRTDGSVDLYDNGPYSITFAQDGPVQKCAAIGSGREAAMGAMLAGATAAQAVKIASLVCEGVGNGVDTL